MSIFLKRDFHGTLYAAAARPRLLGMIKSLQINCDRIQHCVAYRHWFYGAHSVNGDERSQKEHDQILAACQQRDMKTAVRLLKRHIETDAEQLILYLRNA